MTINWKEIHPILSEFAESAQSIENMGYYDDIEYNIDMIAYQFSSDDQPEEFNDDFFSIKVNVFREYVFVKGCTELKAPLKKLVKFLRNKGYPIEDFYYDITIDTDC